MIDKIDLIVDSCVKDYNASTVMTLVKLHEQLKARLKTAIESLYDDINVSALSKALEKKKEQ